MRVTTLIVGLGSAHGDDQIGWRVAERLAASNAGFGDRPAAVSIRIVRSPSELLDWLDGVNRLIVCDACQNVGAPGASLRFCWPNEQVAMSRTSGSHDIGLADVLALAEQLHRLPKEVVIFCGQAEETTPGSSLSASGELAVSGLIEKISRELERRPSGQ